MADGNRHDGAAVDAVAALDDEIGLRDLQRFVNVLRGYDRIEVDECLSRIAAAMAALRDELDTARRERQQAEGRGAVPAAAGTAPSGPAEAGFGARAERLLRLAEAEAREVRGDAAREAAAIVEQAPAESEQLRHQREKELIARSAALERDAAQRSAELQEREDRVAEQLDEIRREADSARVAARRDIDALREQARAEIAGLRSAAEADAVRLREQAGAEVERLRELGTRSRGELQRLVDLVRDVLGQDRADGDRADGDRADGDADGGQEQDGAA